MNPERQRRVEELFLELAELGPADRPARLEAGCNGDADIRREVLSLLGHHDVAGEFLSPSEIREAGLLEDSALLPPNAKIGDYTVISVLGSGGMGVVYLAEQDKPRRTVALKLIRRLAATPALLRRFEHEAEMLAKLHHPGIAQIFAAGTADTGFGAQPFIAMELVRGATLTGYTGAHTLSVADRLRLIIRICEAVQHAHQRGVIHRDLKPGNILIDDSSGVPQPKILDFGVARAVDAEIDATSLHTSAGQLLGTLAYMSPEQVAAQSDDIDTRSDVYSLGVLLFELLAGKLPINTRGRSLPEAARMIRDDKPPKLSTYDRVYRGDLEVIAAKALDKDRARRYQSAADLAADLQRHLEGRPIAAKQDSALYVLGKQMARNKQAFAAVILGLLALVVFAIFALIQASSEYRANLAAQLALEEANLQSQRADATAEKLRAQLSASNVEQGRLQGRAGQVDVATDLIWREHLAHPGSDHTFWALWELYSRAPCLVTTQAHDNEVLCVAIDRAGELVATGDTKGVVRLWDARTLAPRGELKGKPGSIWSLAFSPDSSVLLTAEAAGRLVFWDLASRQELRSINTRHPVFRSLSLRPDGQRVLSVGSDGTLREWDFAMGSIVREEKVHRAILASVTYDRRGLSFAAGADDGAIELWRNGESPPTELRGHTEGVVGLSFAPDGRLATGSNDRTIKIWDTDTGAELLTLTAPNGFIRSLAFSADGSELYSSGWWTIDTWDTSTGQRSRVWPVRIRPDMITLNPAGDRFYSALSDGSLEIWETRRQPAAVNLPGHAGRLTAALSGDGRLVATGDYAGIVRLWAAADGRQLARFDAHAGHIRNTLLDPAGVWLASGADDDNLRLWDLSTGRMISEAKLFENVSCHAIAYEPRRNLIAYTRTDRTIVLAKAPSLEILATLPAARGQLLSLKFNPEGSTLVSVNRGDEVKLWDVQTALDGKYSATLKPPLVPVRTGPQAQPWTTAFSPDGETMLLGDWTKTVQIWDFKQRTLQGLLEGHAALVYDVAFRPGDPSKIASCSADGTIKLWSLPDRRCLLTIDPFSGWDAITVEFTSDGRGLLCASADGSAKLWDLHYFDRHIAGNLEYELGRCGPGAVEPANAEALRDWARTVLDSPAPAPVKASSAGAGSPDLSAIEAWGHPRS